MLPYAPAARRPVVALSPPIRRHSPRPELSQTFDEILGMPQFMGDVLRLVFHGATTWLGIHVGLKEGGSAVGIVGWILGIGNGVAGACDAVSLAKRALGTHPPEDAAPERAEM